MHRLLDPPACILALLILCYMQYVSQYGLKTRLGILAVRFDNFFPVAICS